MARCIYIKIGASFLCEWNLAIISLSMHPLLAATFLSLSFVAALSLPSFVWSLLSAAYLSLSLTAMITLSSSVRSALMTAFLCLSLAVALSLYPNSAYHWLLLSFCPLLSGPSWQSLFSTNPWLFLLCANMFASFSQLLFSVYPFLLLSICPRQFGFLCQLLFAAHLWLKFWLSLVQFVLSC